MSTNDFTRKSAPKVLRRSSLSLKPQDIQKRAQGKRVKWDSSTDGSKTTLKSYTKRQFPIGYFDKCEGEDDVGRADREEKEANVKEKTTSGEQFVRQFTNDVVARWQSERLQITVSQTFNNCTFHTI